MSSRDSSKKRGFFRLRTLRAQITLGFLAVLLLHLTVAVLSHVGLQRAEESAVESSTRHRELTRVLQTDRTVLALQRNVLSFMYTGDANLAEYVKSTAADLEHSLVELESTVQSPIGQSSLIKMHTALQAYRSGFDAVVADRGRREDVLRDSVFPFSERARRLLVEVADEARVLSDQDLAAQASRGLQALSDAGASISAYMLEPGGQIVRDFRRQSRECSVALAQLHDSALSPELKGRVVELSSGVESWERAVLEVVNSTRSYLHLGNVVLAGQAHEFLVLSGAFTQDSIQEGRAREAKIAASHEQYQTTANVVGALTVLGGLLAGYLISRSVSNPITAMTATLSGLAQGREERIGELDREDEIGEMARAAEVFAQRNQETRELLAHANELTKQQAFMNEKLAHSVEELEQRNEDLDSFSYSASHDLRAPLRGISLLARWIREDGGDSLNEAASEHLDLLAKRVVRLEGLLEGLLEYSRSGRSLDAVEEVHVLSLALETVEGLGLEAGLNLIVEGDDVSVSTPPVALQKVIQNLISNAVSHNDKDEARIEIRVLDRGDRVEI
ncbi:MAG: histidine kinase dimerization/phospho-acceptor domain-containing protein, partial [Planctomycetota bacterium]